MRYLLLLLSLCVSACSGDTLQRSPAYFFPSDNSFDFGDVELGSSSQRILTVVNRGDQPLTVEHITFDGLAGVFTAELDTNTADVGSSVALKVSFKPTDPVRYATLIHITNNSDNEPKFVFSVSGRGLAPDPCKNKICNDPPSTGRCVDVNTREFFKASGTCQAGTCVYDTETMECQFGCNADTGSCRGDPCANVTCTEPPGVCYFPRGECHKGACQYQVRDDIGCDDGNLCSTGDRCFGGLCIGLPKTCELPPEPWCTDAQTRRLFDPVGVCTQATGGCEYTQRDQYCSYGCGNGRCSRDPCEGVVCNAPPGSCYAAQGTCDRGVCRYDVQNNIPCDDRDPCTQSDTCTSGSCRGTPLACLTPPASLCTGAQSLTTYSSPGACRTGACEYSSQNVSCEFGCVNNTCAPPPDGTFDTVRVEMDVNKSSPELWEFDSRDAALRLHNPLDSDCSRDHPSITGWDRVYGTCSMQSRNNNVLYESMTHSADLRGDGAYGVRVLYRDDCSNMSCFGGFCICTGTGSMQVKVRLYVNQRLSVQCTNSLGNKGDLRRLFVIQRTGGHVSGVTLTPGMGCEKVL